MYRRERGYGMRLFDYRKTSRRLQKCLQVLTSTHILRRQMERKKNIDHSLVLSFFVQIEMFLKATFGITK